MNGEGGVVVSATRALREKMSSPTPALPESSERRPQKSPFRKSSILSVCALLLVAVMLGGGGGRYGLANLLVQLTALGLLAVYRKNFFDFWRTTHKALAALLLCTLALPILQLVPLPEEVWTALPGRELAVEARLTADRVGWAPASLDDSRTLVALTGLIVPLTVLSVGSAIERNKLFLMGWMVVAMGLVNVILGIGQALSSDPTASFYPENPMPGVLFGTFANRNSTGLFLVCALTFAALLPSPREGPLVLPLRLGICVVLLLGIILTKSRTALALAALPMLLSCMRFAYAHIALSSSAGSRIWRFLQLAVGALIAGLAVVSLFSSAPGRLGDTLARFDDRGDNARYYIWEDSLYAAERYWPAGAGMGTFDEVFQLDESLENLTVRRAGRAHNDYIEVAIEAGIAGLLIIVAWLALVASLTWRARLSSQRWTAWSGSAILLAIALQSITDYPLRNQAMLAVGALALLTLARHSVPPSKPSRAAA